MSECPRGIGAYASNPHVWLDAIKRDDGDMFACLLQSLNRDKVVYEDIDYEYSPSIRGAVEVPQYVRIKSVDDLRYMGLPIPTLLDLMYKNNAYHVFKQLALYNKRRDMFTDLDL